MQAIFKGKNVYGRELFYPANDAANAVCILLNRKTLNLAEPSCGFERLEEPLRALGIALFFKSVDDL